MLIETLIILALIMANGFLALSELAVVSSRRSRLDHLVSRGRRGARTALRLHEDQGRFLPTVQIGITFVGIISGAFSGTSPGRTRPGRTDGFARFAPGSPG